MRRPAGSVGIATGLSVLVVLDQLIRAIRAGESRVLVVYGEPSVGKTALLEYLAVQALGCRVTRVAGVQSELELAFAGLHQLCAPLLDRLDGRRLPDRRGASRQGGDWEQPRAVRRLGSGGLPR